MHMNDDDEDAVLSRDSVDESAPLLPSSSSRMSTPHGLETKSKRSSSTSDHDRDLEADAQPELLVTPGPVAEERRSGAERIEALYRVFGKGGLSIWALYGIPACLKRSSLYELD
ncbi:uncharacterized protein STEHIDRAFT_154389 [Stereum hirsutum FP-91666 SS1]|uniref:uncharacterized protein n=1 Tax=Stereum hirsutum (strain FP-91666) TaxID=721885 RepID=UPI000440F11B|nr:uncharacterized protein STEHIDRAFT_154389 [Stereum hirsutum FP-91666 SS1]EIM88662.1 hypothetical protein STEHIDRAFT_154389 [Stereum hirsutum FP-91666 SS1]